MIMEFLKLRNVIQTKIGLKLEQPFSTVNIYPLRNVIQTKIGLKLANGFSSNKNIYSSKCNPD